MKSCLGMLFTLALLAALVGGIALLWYLSDTLEVSRNDAQTVSIR